MISGAIEDVPLCFCFAVCMTGAATIGRCCGFLPVITGLYQ